MKIFETLLVCAFFLAYILIGVYFNRKALNNRSDFYVASGKVNLPINTLATFAAFASGGSFLGSIGVAYSFSLSYIWSAIVGSVSGFIIASVLVAPYLSSMKLNSLVDFFKERYNNWKVLRIVGGAIVVVAFTLYLVSQYKAAGITAEYLLGWDYVWTLLLVTIIFVFYTSIGGMWAVTMTEAIQAVLMFIFMILLPIFAVINLGGPAKMISKAIEISPNWSALGVPLTTAIGFALVWTFTVSCFPHISMRILASKSSNVAQKTMGYTGLLYGIFCLVGFIGVSAAALNLFPIGTEQALKDPDYAYIAVMEQYFPPVLQGFATAAIIAAVLSTTSGLLLAISVAVSNDIWSSIFPNTKEKTVLRIGKISIFVAGIVSALFALNPPALLVILYSQATAMMTSGFFGPLVLGIWWKKATRQGALANMIIGSGGFAVLYALNSLKVITLPTFAEFLIALPLGLIANIIVSNATFNASSSESQEMIHKMDEVHKNAQSVVG
ncbi:sodium/solute symporter [Neobacillus sp. 114]|uniref:sodium:solute symporter family protein n=1 Tax=Neobacillus sp. 114 TaxID=3048535 RepID=UPI0024C32D55|nr:sodium/solute symporter [Neobacillus sp. 114]